LNDDENVVLHRKAKIPNTENHIDLLLIHEEEKSHYVYITDFDKLMVSQHNTCKCKMYFL